MQFLRISLVLVLASCRDPDAARDALLIPELAHVKKGRAHVRLPAPEQQPTRPHFPPSGILRNNASSFDVERWVIDRALEQQSELMHCARIVPEQADGRVVGIRFFPRAGSLATDLGFESGDVIVTVNGWDLTSPERALEAYARLRSATLLVAGLRRRDVPMEIEYRIWD